MFYPSKANNNNEPNILSEPSSLVLVRCNYWSEIGRNFADLVSKEIVCDKIYDNEKINRNPSFIDINNNETVKPIFVGIQIHFVLIHRTEGYCKILYTQKVNIETL